MDGMISCYFDDDGKLNVCPEYDITIYFDTEEERDRFSKKLVDSDKYKWHDLHKDPEDLPDDEIRVECVTETRTGSRNHVFGYHSDGRWCCGMNSNVIAWRHIEPFEEDNE